MRGPVDRIRAAVAVAWWVLMGAATLPHAGAAQRPVSGAGDTVQVPEALVPTAARVADSLLALGDMRGAYDVLSARLDVAGDDVGARLMAVQVATGLGLVGGDAATRLHWLRTADAQGAELLRRAPDDPDAMAWAAAARGRRAMAEDGARMVVRLAQDVWAITGDLLAVAPDHPLGNLVRGKLHYEAMRLSRPKRFFARVFLGFDLAGDASWAGAQAHMEKALAGDPGMIFFYLDLGDTYRAQGKLDQAEATYRRGLARPDSLPVDGHLKGLLRRRLERLGR